MSAINMDRSSSRERTQSPATPFARSRPRTWLSMLAAAVIGLVLTLVLTSFAWQREQSIAQERLESIAGDHFDALQTGLNQYLDRITALRGLFETTDKVTREDFEIFADRIIGHQKAIEALDWVPRITRNERAAHELAGIRDGIPGYQIKAILPDGSLARSPERDEYLPIFYSSNPRTSQIYGFDLLSDPNIKDKLERARDDDQLAVVPDTILHSKNGNIHGLLFSMPVYRRNRPTATIEDRRRNLVGFAHGAFFVAQAIEDILASNIKPAGLDLYLFAPDAAGDAASLYVHSSLFRTMPAEAKSRSILASGAHVVGMLSASDTHWTLVAVPLAGGPLSARHDRSWAVLVIGFFVTALVLLHMRSSARFSNRLLEANERITDLAEHDALTGLANRRAFNERVAQLFAAARRGQGSFAVLYFDLDHFKDVNDTLGHPIGDLLLQQVAARVKDTVRREDSIARFGGDEFAILQTDADLTTATALAARVLEVIARPFMVDGNTVHITASIGIAQSTTETVSPDVLIMQSDIALYRAKHDGRNCFRFHNAELDREVVERVSTAEDLHTAVEHDELRLHYQPQVELQSGRIIGVEALLRWQHPSRGLLAPTKFIAIAEQTGSISAIGAWAFDQACRQMKSWCDLGAPPGVMAVNVSPRQFDTGTELENFLVATLTKWRIEPTAVEIELTESQLMEVTHQRRHSVDRLRELGIRIAIDDFGTGYSSLTYLTSFSVNRLKIAQELVLGVIDDPRNATVVRAAIRLADELGIECIAEGIETPEQLKFLIEAGCRYGQGYYFSAPLDAELMTDLLKERMVKPARMMPRLDLVVG